ncbi:MAG: DUF4037 domain-containing protein [Gaiellaceae bacterium]
MSAGSDSGPRQTVEETFTPGVELARAFYIEAIEPLLRSQLPAVRAGAALLGPGSDVLGFDTPLSADRDWGPRLQLFLGERELAHQAPLIERLLRFELPVSFHGHPTSFEKPDRWGRRHPQQLVAGPVDPAVEVTSVRRFSTRIVGFDPREEAGARHWLLAPQQRLLELTSGEVFADPAGELAELRERLSFYPRDVWLYLLASQWWRVGRRDEAAVRAGMAGDDIGSRLLVAGLVRDLIRLAFLLERRYAPYDQWLGRAFERLGCAAQLAPALARVLTAYDWTQRQIRLAESFAILIGLHNSVGLTAPVATELPRSSRGLVSVGAERLALPLQAAIVDPELRRLPPFLGGADQLVASDELLTDARLLAVLGGCYETQTR